jgi:putative transposase
MGTQQARQVCWTLDEQTPPIRFLIQDRDTKFAAAFDTVFQSGRIEVIHTPYRTPNANAFAERWVRSVREECLDRLLIVNERHLRQTLQVYVAYYNTRRPHQGLDQQCPIPFEPVRPAGSVQRHDILGGILHDYPCSVTSGAEWLADAIRDINGNVLCIVYCCHGSSKMTNEGYYRHAA